jgi:osmotically-inducible protein OsmY
MATGTLTNTDLRLRDAVLQQLEWDPQVDASAIGVTARDGVVSLTGAIGTYAGKLAAERAAKRMAGVRAVANELEVRLAAPRGDEEIAAEIVQVLRFQGRVPATVQASVRSGHVTLTGQVDGHYQRLDAERAVRHIRGIRHLANHITVRPAAVPRDVRRRIVEALHRNADVDARHIVVTVTGETATLTGSVATWQQQQAAGRAAADAPGITQVDNRVVVSPGPLEEVEEIC